MSNLRDESFHAGLAWSRHINNSRAALASYFTLFQNVTVFTVLDKNEIHVKAIV